MRIQDPNKIVLAAKKKNKLRIMVDLDGVLVNWEEAAVNTCGIDYKDQEIRDALKNGKRVEEFIDGGDDKMWSMIDKEGEDWWVNLKKLPWADDLIKLAKEESKEVSFLSSPSDQPVCYSGKVKWVIKHRKDMARDIFLGCQKHRVANPNILLIDDTEKKVKKFREYGGHAFLWPHPLSIIDGDLDIEDVFKDLRDYIKEIK